MTPDTLRQIAQVVHFWEAPFWAFAVAVELNALLVISLVRQQTLLRLLAIIVEQSRTTQCPVLAAEAAGHPAPASQTAEDAAPDGM